MRPPAPAVRRKFQRRLLAWYRRHGRDLPWRRTREPYRVLVSEIMLQQTQVDRVVPKYHEFLRRYPTMERLAAARYGGKLPAQADTLRGLPGIGRYTAGAILSFAYGRDVPVLDTNVRRVLGRVFLGPRRLRRARGERLFWDLAGLLVPRGRGYDFNQALMDFGATWCRPRRPRCLPCPMRTFCASYPCP